MSDIPQMEIRESGGGFRPSVIWIVPVVAVAIALGIAWRSYSDRGPLIEVSFDQANGIVKGQTQLKYRALTVGTVEDLTFTPDLSAVIAHIRLDKSVAQFVDADARFWVVQPQVTARGVTGLDTVLSGVFIEGSWDATPGEPVRQFQGTDTPPLVPLGARGTVIRLRADTGGQVQAGAPVIYRGVTVGNIDAPALEPDGSAVTARAFIEAPEDQPGTSATRFWGVGGFSVNVGPGGLRLDVGNIASLIEGGITFGTVGPPGQPTEANALFTVFKDETSARSSTATEIRDDEIVFSTIFEGALGGLETGAAVEMAGAQIGQVLAMSSVIGGDGEPRLRVDLGLRPRELGLPEGADETTVADRIGDLVENGVRAQLTVESLFSGGLKVVLAEMPDLPPGTLDRGGDPFPVIPAAPVDVTNLNASATGIADRIANLPVEDLMASAVGLLDSVRAILDSPGLREAPKAAVDLLNSAKTQVDAFDAAPIMADLQAAIADLRGVIGTFGKSENLAKVDQVLTDLEAATAQLAPLLASVRSVADNAAAVDLQALVDQAEGTLAGVNALLAAPETQAIPGEVQAILAEARGLLTSDAVRALPAQAGEAIDSATRLLGTVQTSEGLTQALAALERLDGIASSVEATAQGLPELRQQVSAVLAKAEALDLAPLLASANATAEAIRVIAEAPATQALPGTINTTLEGVQGLVASEPVQALPGELAAAMASLQGILATVQDSNGIPALMAAMNRLDGIAQSVETTAAGLPELRQQIADILAKAEAVELQPLVDSATASAVSVETLLNDPGTRALPGQVTAILEEARTLLGSDEVQALPGTLGRTVASAEALLNSVKDSEGMASLMAALERLDAIAASVETTASGLPELRQQVSDLVAKADALPVEQVLTSADQVLQSGDRLLAQPETQALPGSLGAALDQLAGTLSDLRAGGTVENVNATLQSASEAADALAAAADNLPELVTRLNALIVTGEGLVSAYGDRSAFNLQAVGALNDMREAARSVTSLARAIERNPSALIRGR